MTQNRQVEQIQRQQRDRGARRRLVEKFIRRRAGSNVSQFAADELSDREVLVLDSQLVAVSSSIEPTRVRDLIDEADFSISPVGGLDNRVSLLTKSGAQLEELTRLLEQLRLAGAEASLAYVTPTKVVMKAEATPESAPHRPPFQAPPPPPEGAVRVVVLDTGVAECGRKDGWLAGLQTPRNEDPLDVYPRPNGYLDFAAGHGSFIAAQYQQVLDGSAEAFELRAERVLDTDGIVGEIEVASAMAACVREELDPGTRLLLNLSFGTDTIDDKPPIALREALAIIREVEAERGGEVMLVSAAGNEGDEHPCWPAAFAAHDAKVVAVAALDWQNEPAGWSTHGEWVTCSVRGAAVQSAFVTGTEDQSIDPKPESFGQNAFASWTGTSFAAPQVGAHIAAIAQQQGIGLVDALRRLKSTKGIGTDPSYGTLLGL